MSVDAEQDVEVRRRVDQWIEESRDVLARAIPGILDDRQRQRARAETAETACEEFRRATSDLRGEMGELHAEIQRLRSELVKISTAASTAIGHVPRALHGPEESAQTRPISGSRAYRAACIALGVVAAILVASGVAVRFLPTTGSTPPAERPGDARDRPTSSTPPAQTPERPPDPTPTVTLPPRTDLPRTAPLPATEKSVAHTATPLRQSPEPAPRNDIRNFRAESVSGREMKVTVDYSYVGDHGVGEIFMHAVALQHDGWSSRVPGTGFPETAISVGDGRATINIEKVENTGSAISTHVKVCMVSIRDRSAFVCKNFPYTKAWE